MATNLNNIHINSFTKGMNTDTSLDMVGNELYVFGLNVRITNNTTLGLQSDPNSKEGVIVPIDKGENVNWKALPYDEIILATTSIGDVGAIVTHNEEYWFVYKVDYNELKLTKVFEDLLPTDEDNNPIIPKQVSTVINKELENVINLYIADGYHEIMMLNLCDEEAYLDLTAEDLISNRYFPARKLTINKKISGRLRTSQVQYTFRFYKKHGIRSKLAPVTNKILIIDSNRNKEIGNAENTETSIGLQLKINVTDKEKNIFDHVQVYRLSYLKPNTNADIDLIYDSKFDGDVTINDTGIESLQGLSIEEFAALDTMDVVPQCIEQNQNYLFIANVADKSKIAFKENFDYDTRAFLYNKDGKIVLYKDTDTIYSEAKEFDNPDDIPDDYTLNKYVDMNDPETDNPCKYNDGGYYGGTGKNISWMFVTTYMPIYDSNNTESLSYPLTMDQNDSTIYYFNDDGTVITRDSLSKVCSQNGINIPYKVTYEDNIISSMYRSLKRNEVYRYGIVFYDENGNRSDVKWIADIRTPDNSNLSIIEEFNGEYYSLPIGIQFFVNNLPSTVKGYQIVRCEKNKFTTKNLMQVILSRPVHLKLYTNNDDEKLRYSPYYPSFILTSAYQRIHVHDDSISYEDTIYTETYSVDNYNVFQIFSPEICYRQQDALQTFSGTVFKLKYAQSAYGNDIDVDNEYLRIKSDDSYFKSTYPITLSERNADAWNIYRIMFEDSASVINSNYNTDHGYRVDLRSIYNKESSVKVFNWFNSSIDSDAESITSIKDIKNTPMANWEDAVTNVQLNGADITSATLGYKSFNVSIGGKEYNNWVSNGMYNLRASTDMAQDGLSKHSGDTYGGQAVLLTKDDFRDEDKNARHGGRFTAASGYIGVGPKCFIMATEDIDELNPINTITKDSTHISTAVCNIQHAATLFAGLTNSDKQYDVYYGFGNYYPSSNSTSYVFDGDVYIVPFELVTMYKTYNFNSNDTIPSALFVYYLPIETPINTYFDYGMNYRNTQSKNLMLEPGEIEGIASQDRPLYQYNMIYSDNNRSNDVFNAQALEDTQDTYSQRIFYSELKTSGESIDSWSDFKPLNYIDADTRHGGINNLLTSKDILYFWQDKAFGRLSVNERSLITDTNSNTIQLGQGGVIQRTDYISTTYGMRPQDFSAISIDGVIFWIDIKNNCIVQSTGQNAVNYSEGTNVLNIMNHDMSIDIPKIDYDIQNNELLCKCLKDGKQLVFNVKLNAATSVYTRDYQSMIMFDNTLYGLWSCKKYNNTDNIDGYEDTEIQFVVNPSSSTTKVFDNQEISLIDNYTKDFTKDKVFKFQTNIIDDLECAINASTNREGNVQYAIPRYGNNNYGNRMRGKWMKLTIIDNDTTAKSGISHVITKFRQSFN